MGRKRKCGWPRDRRRPGKAAAWMGPRCGILGTVNHGDGEISVTASAWDEGGGGDGRLGGEHSACGCDGSRVSLPRGPGPPDVQRPGRAAGKATGFGGHGASVRAGSRVVTDVPSGEGR